MKPDGKMIFPRGVAMLLRDFAMPPHGKTLSSRVFVVLTQAEAMFRHDFLLFALGFPLLSIRKMFFALGLAFLA